jgi:hypothetical protein
MRAQSFSLSIAMLVVAMVGLTMVGAFGHAVHNLDVVRMALVQ